MNIEADKARIQILYQSGRCRAALEIARRVIEQKTDESLLALTGALALEEKEYTLADTVLLRALDINPDNSKTLYLLGIVSTRLGELKRSATYLEKAVKLDPDFLEAHLNLGNVHMNVGRTDQAIDIYRKITDKWPDCTEAQHNLGTLLRLVNREEDALKVARTVADMAPDDAVKLTTLANMLHHDGDDKEAEKLYRKILKINPQADTAYLSLAQILIATDRTQDAIDLLTRGIVENPGNESLIHQLAMAFYKAKRYTESRDLFLQITNHQQPTPEQANRLFDLSLVLTDIGELCFAEQALERLLYHYPTTLSAYMNLALLKQRRGEHVESIDISRKGLAFAEDSPGIYHNHLYFLSYHPTIDQRTIYKESRTWAKLAKNKAKVTSLPFQNDRNPDRKLKIGYISPDLMGHVVANFVSGIFECHDRSNFEIHAFASVSKFDGTSAVLKSNVDHWHDIFGVPDDDVVTLIRENEIDILIDLAGHTAGTRITTMIHRPAPIQATWIGYPNTTGLSEVDYRLTDAIADPEGPNDDFYSEKLVRLKQGFLCFNPSNQFPDISPTPALQKGYVTFGCFNQSRKLSKETITLWARVVSGIPNARLFLKGLGMEFMETKQNLLNLFEEGGLDRHRISITGPTANYQNHMALFSKVDIALDPFPYNGATTTCETMWLGVPVISLIGDIHAARVSASIIDQIGLTDQLVATTEAGYEKMAHDLASDLDALNKLRLGMRDRIQQSRLIDKKAHTLEVEQVFRDWWHHWLKQEEQSLKN